MTKDELALGATLLAHTDAIAALIAVLTNEGKLHPKLFEVALEGVQAKHPEKPEGTSFMEHPNYQAPIKAFLAATRKDF
ncbi:hypothetical protein [Pseudomonas sp. NC02]|uniref:hypothetical protein n=1 Tax=Pseudomonas sp. NC02 TaxID=2067572 RepID=UPI000C854868|nr:hypothetical protein [Pseudomonas sp. NC02]AUO22510.1 hypothetical protein C0058_11095 [Pseudomonas sp. NC02]